MRMAHQRLDRLEIVSVIQESSGKRVAHHMRVDPLLNQSLLRQRFDEAVNSLGSKVSFVVGTMFSQCPEEGMARICPIPGGFEVILNGEEGV